MSDFLCESDRRLEVLLSPVWSAVDAEVVHFVEKGWDACLGQEVWYVSCDSHPEIIRN